MPTPLVLRVAGAVLALLVVAACTEAGTTGGEPRPRAAASAGPSGAATTAAAYDPGPWTSLSGRLGRCGPQPPRLATAHFRPTSVRGPGVLMPAVTTGSGPTVAVLLHQTNGNGLCGWLTMAQRIGEVPGQQALAFDLCGYGRSRCRQSSSPASEQVGQVRRAVDVAVRRLGARRVVLVGASMGGSLAVLTAVTDRRVDAVVDLSGRDEWGGAVVHRRAAGLHVPVLVAMADSEGPDEVAHARDVVDSAPAGSVFVGADGGHGYDLLEDTDGRPTALADQVLAWVAGP